MTTGRWTVELSHADGTIPLKMYRSRESGLLVFVADVPGPIVQLFTTIRTEAHDSRGLPHTLEHLVFLGCESLPYKGVLDSLAQMAYANGTNAWTAQDHTTYTLSSGSAKGVHTLLPLYLEHIFFPLLKPKQFLTEVHSVNADGDDVGVVFCEMQGIEQLPSNVAFMKLSRLLYPGENGYGGIETGGLLADLRSPECNMDAIRDYHAQTYRPDNAIVFICGSALDHGPLLDSLEEIDTRLATRLSKLPKMTERPFSRKLDPLVPTEASVEFPSETETYGQVDIGFRLPGSIAENCSLVTELGVLGDYLSDGLSSPLHVGLVDLPDPFAQSVSISCALFAEVSFTLRLRGVPLDKMKDAKERALAILEDICKSEELDLDRLHSVINSSWLSETSELEKDAAETIQDNVSLAFLYFDVKKDLVNVLFGEKTRLATLLKERCSEKSIPFWIDMLRKYVVDAPKVVVFTRPSIALNEQISAREEEIRAERAKTLDLVQLNKELEEAKAEMLVPCPPDVLLAYKQRMADGVNEKAFHPIETFRAGSGVEPYEQEPNAWLAAHCHQLGKLPFGLVQVDHYGKTEFVDVSVAFDVSSIQDAVLLELWSELMFALPLSDLPDHLEVDRALARDLLDYKCGVGMFRSSNFNPGQWGDLYMLKCRAKVENYEKAVHWMRRCLFDCVVSSERLMVALNTLLTQVDEEQRDESTVMCSAKWDMLYDRKCVAAQVTLKNQAPFLKKFRKLVKRKPRKAEERVDKFLAQLRICAQRPLVHLVADFSRIANPMRPWLMWPFIGRKAAALPLALRPASAHLRRPKRIFCNSVSVTRIATEGAYLTEWWSAPGYEEPDAMATCLVLCEFLECMEGLLWVAVRNAGLAYGIGVYHDVEAGLFELRISRSASSRDVAEARRASKEVLLHLDPVAVFTEEALDSAKSIAMGSLLRQLETHTGAASGRYKSLLRGVSFKWLLARVAGTTVSDLRNAYKKYMRKSLRKGTAAAVVISLEDEDFEDAE